MLPNSEHGCCQIVSVAAAKWGLWVLPNSECGCCQIVSVVAAKEGSWVLVSMAAAK